MNHTTVKGFTLIELMMVVTVIGVLSWIAVPKYQNHMLKATAATQSISAIRPIQNALSEYVAYNGQLPSSYSDLSSIGFVANDGSVFSQATDFVNGAVSSIDVAFPNDDDTMIFSVSFACNSVSSNGCSRIAPKALQSLTLDISATLQKNNGSIRYFIDPSRTKNLAFQGFLPKL